MATKKQPAKEALIQAAPVFEKEALIQAAPTFGIMPEVMAGALYDVKEPITQDQAKEKVKAFLARTIK